MVGRRGGNRHGEYEFSFVEGLENGHGNGDGDIDHDNGSDNGGNSCRDSRKKRKTSHESDHEQVSKEPTRPFKKRWPEADIFPFLELPGEIRNKIYGIIIRTTRREFPTSSFSKEHQPGRRTTRPRLEHKAPIPYLNLIHSCRQIRAEFRPLWMKTHQITLGNAHKYIRTFFPPRPKKDIQYYNVRGHLKVYIRFDDIEGRDILPLIKQSFNFPKRKIELTHGPSVQASWVDGLKRLIRNRNPEWSRLVRAPLLGALDDTEWIFTLEWERGFGGDEDATWVEENRMVQV
ncbi:hypothetical protein GRF29_69g138603 [Pseudopithomyces chartarum]|uniref:F-box domain-containing protein n=1 Tax=Pseudopithomyces chartarum TaxID=1892770 RepID=A0AAN6LZH1_9PLEO|nr:hypothetical protein GRF29_69g138603 [Pseudopithomyces chartarum]